MIAVAVIEKGEEGLIIHTWVLKGCDFIKLSRYTSTILRDIKSLSSQEEVYSPIREDFPELDRIVVGYDFRFGYRKSGDVELLRELFSGEVNVVDEIKYRGLSIHSCLIREAIGKGEY